MQTQTQGKYINIFLDEELLKRIDDFRFKNRFASRTMAIRWLIDHALKQKVRVEGS
jgi:metal-responsive CopG/Arc/MetJ family transcriptional regulator